MFRRYYHVFARFKDVKPAGRLTGPSVAAFGWIPFLQGLPPESNFRAYSSPNQKPWLPFSVLEFMFRTGNPLPPDEYETREAFLESLSAREFRGVLALDEVSALIAPSGEIMGVELWYFGAVGATPLRRNPKSRLKFYSSGNGDSDHSMHAIPEEYVTFEIWQTFKVSRLVDAAQYFATGARATSAAVRIDYTFRINRSIEIAVGGSAVPSQCHYLDWRRQPAVHDMTALSLSDIENFFGSGACETAPMREPLTLVDVAEWDEF